MCARDRPRVCIKHMYRNIYMFNWVKSSIKIRVFMIGVIKIRVINIIDLVCQKLIENSIQGRYKKFGHYANKFGFPVIK